MSLKSNVGKLVQKNTIKIFLPIIKFVEYNGGSFEISLGSFIVSKLLVNTHSSACN